MEGLMDIQAPEPETEDVCDLDFTFLGNVQTSMTLVTGSTDRISWYPDSIVITKGNETIRLFIHNLLYSSERTRKRPVPVPVAKKVTPTL